MHSAEDNDLAVSMTSHPLKAFRSPRLRASDSILSPHLCCGQTFLHKRHSAGAHQGDLQSNTAAESRYCGSRKNLELGLSQHTRRP